MRLSIGYAALCHLAYAVAPGRGAATQSGPLERGEGWWRFREPQALFWVGSRPDSRPEEFVLGVVAEASQPPVPGEGLIDVSRRLYHPTRHPMEVRLLRFLKSYRARFVPVDQPVVGKHLKPHL